MAHAVSLDSMPFVDNHSHASMYEQRDGSSFRTIRENQELYARGFIESRVPPATWRDYVRATATRDAERLGEIDREHRVRDLMEQSLGMHRTTVFTRALEIGCRELYGEWEDRERLARVSLDARREGVAPLYERVLDLTNTRVVVADTPRLDRAAWPEERFKRIARLDPFFYPFGPDQAAARGTEVPVFYTRFAGELDSLLLKHGLDACPRDFADYLAFVDRALESILQEGIVGLKVISAYVRSLEFRPVAESEAARVFGDLARGKRGEGRLLEDFMARRLLLWAAERSLPVQVHVGLGHAEPGMDFRGNNPLMLQSVLMDERFSNLQLIVLHGAYPFCGEASSLVWTYGNVYLDFSWMCYLHYHFLIDRLSEWLELLPAHKLLFGSDTGLPELHLGGMRLGRRAIEAALSRGVEAGIWSTSQAHWLGERVCYRNACDLYGVEV